MENAEATVNIGEKPASSIPLPPRTERCAARVVSTGSLAALHCPFARAVHVITMKPSCTLDEALTETASDKTLPSDRAKKLLGRKLKELKQTIEARNDKARKDNEEITIPYQYLHPATVSASVAI